MRIPSGVTDQYVYFVAVDSTDFATRETGLSSFTVYRSRDGAAAAAMTTPTINETDATNMPGVYELLLDEDTTLTAGNDSEEMALHITATGMAPVTRTIEIFRTNVTAISGDTTAADNLELMYDGTGYTDDTAPASRSQVGQLSVGSASISTTSSSATITTGSQTGTYANTDQLDGVFHQVSDAAGTTDFYYEFQVGGSGVPTEFSWDGYMQSNGDTYQVYAYNWDGTSWDQIGARTASNGTTMVADSWPATTAHVGTGADIGKVRLRFESTDGTDIFTDRILCSYAVVAQSVGYANGAIWIDTSGSNTSTESYIDGVADNPVSTWAAALTLSGQLGLKRFQLTASSSITLTGNSDAYDIVALGSDVALGGQSIEGTVITGATLTGTGTSTVTPPQFFECSIAATIPPSYMDRCGFPGTITAGSAGDFFVVDCFSQVAGASSPEFDMGSGIGATNLSVRRFGGGLAISNLDTGDVVSAESTVGGTLTLTGAGGTVEARGGWKQVTSGGFSGTLTDVSVNTRTDDTQGATFVSGTDSLEAIRNRGDSAWTTGAGGSSPTVGEIADAVWDETLADHLGAGSTGNALNAAGAAGDPWSTALPGAYGAGTAGKIIGDNINAPLDTIDTVVDAIKAVTDLLPNSGALTDLATQASVDVIDGNVDAILVDTGSTLPGAISAVPTAIENADALLNRDMSAVSDTNARTPLNAFRFLRNKYSVSGTTLTVTKEDDSTSAWSATLTTDAAADPVTGSDPS